MRMFGFLSGDPALPSSLHYFNKTEPRNQYTSAIDAVGKVVQEYDADKKFPVYGFGGVFFGSGVTSQCFPLVCFENLSSSSSDNVIHNNTINLE